MLVKELIERLQKIDPDAKVEIEVGEENGYDGYYLREVELKGENIYVNRRGDTVLLGS